MLGFKPACGLPCCKPFPSPIRPVNTHLLNASAQPPSPSRTAVILRSVYQSYSNKSETVSRPKKGRSNAVGYQKLHMTGAPRVLANGCHLPQSNNMATPSDDEFFDDVMTDLADEVVELGELGIGESVASAVREQLDPGVFDNPLEAVVRALELFSKAMGDLYDGRSPAIDSEETSCRLLEAGLVNIVCGFLPDPQTLERSKQDLGELELVVNGFQEIVKFLRKVIGRKELEASCDDDLLWSLYLISDLAADPVTAFGRTSPAHKVLVDELYFLAWETRHNIPTRGHKAHITDLLDYLRWHVQGRKDMSCPVAKPWAESSTVESTQGFQDDLSRLLPADFSATCVGCSAIDARFPCVECQFTGGHQFSTVYCNQVCLEAHSAAHAAPCKETRDLIRAARLFQVVFEQFLRFTKTKIGFTVSKEDGVVRKGYTPHASPPMDFHREEVQAALHNLCCNAPQYEAKMLLEKIIQRE